MRWVDVVKSDGTYRSRLVAKEFRKGQIDGIFAATPPLECVRYLISKCSTHSDNRLMVSDISRAYFYAKSRRPTYVAIPSEDWEEGDEDNCARLEVSMYGTRDAASNWSDCYATHLLGIGFKQSRSNPCLFHHPTKKVQVMVHGDDYLSLGNKQGLKWFADELSKRFECKSQVLGPEGEEGCQSKIRILNRTIAWRSWGLEYIPDEKHAQELIKGAGMSSANSVKTPEESIEGEEEGSGSTPAQKTKYRSLAARANYLAQDRIDMQHATQELAKGMSDPKEIHWRKMKRLARYLVGRERFSIRYAWRSPTKQAIGMTDSNWAGDRVSRKSTSGGILLIGGHVIKSWSRNQSVVALSSAEAELYGAVKCTAELIGLINLAKEWGDELEGSILADASAALGIISRRGVGKVRHLDCSHLWIQEAAASKAISFGKIAGDKNCADILTKPIGAAILEKHMETLNVASSAYREGDDNRGGPSSTIRKSLNSLARKVVVTHPIKSNTPWNPAAADEGDGGMTRVTHNRHSELCNSNGSI